MMYWEEPIFVSDAFSIKTDESLLQIKYVYHFLLQNQQKIHAMKKGSGVPHVYPKDIGTLMIPIPPLSVQTEIVKILDALTTLTSELTSELILRQKQYEYYREKLLSEEELGKVGGEWKNLKDILINLRTGLNPRNNFKLNTDGAENYYITVRELDSVNIKITDKTDKISNQAREIIDKRSKLNIGDILFSGTGTIGKTAFISELPRNWNIKEGVYALTVNQEIIKPMYLLRLLQSEITKKQINNFVMGSTVKSISMADLKKVKILIPSLDEQQCIVSILDKFETLTNSITEGLPLAIEQSQKRYEYYRELLLNFS
ncbi:TPA: restriction endonuclease subunit S [Haemophilus influenzae]|nr:restriction endonuclease subunit S [Haemophilus influenzae]